MSLWSEEEKELEEKEPLTNDDFKVEDQESEPSTTPIAKEGTVEKIKESLLIPMTPTTSFSVLDASSISKTEGWAQAASMPHLKEWQASVNPDLRNHLVQKM